MGQAVLWRELLAIYRYDAFLAKPAPTQLIHNKRLNPFEEAYSYQRLIDEFRLTHEELGRRIGKTQVSITETLKLLALPERIQQEAQKEANPTGRISKSLLLEIARRPRIEQFRLWEEARRGELTVKQVRAARKETSLAKKPRSLRNANFRYPIELSLLNAVVIVEFSAAGAQHIEDVVEALEEALSIERGRIGSLAKPV